MQKYNSVNRKTRRLKKYSPLLWTHSRERKKRAHTHTHRLNKPPMQYIPVSYLLTLTATVAHSRIPFWHKSGIGFQDSLAVQVVHSSSCGRWWCFYTAFHLPFFNLLSWNSSYFSPVLWSQLYLAWSRHSLMIILSEIRCRFVKCFLFTFKTFLWWVETFYSFCCFLFFL